MLRYNLMSYHSSSAPDGVTKRKYRKNIGKLISNLLRLIIADYYSDKDTSANPIVLWNMIKQTCFNNTERLTLHQMETAASFDQRPAAAAAQLRTCTIKTPVVINAVHDRYNNLQHCYVQIYNKKNMYTIMDSEQDMIKNVTYINLHYTIGYWKRW